MRAALAMLVTLAVGSSVRAQPLLTEGEPGAQPMPASPSSTAPMPLTKPSRREPAAAYLLTTAGILAPVLVLGIGRNRDEEPVLVLAAATATLAPSAGHWYAGRFFTIGMGFRAVGSVLVTRVMFRVVADVEGDVGATEMTIGLGALAVGAIWDFATAGTAVHRWNRKQLELELELAPAVVTLRDGRGTGYGVGLAGRF